nr:alcohol dehydrogenase [Hungatella effluvii]
MSQNQVSQNHTSQNHTSQNHTSQNLPRKETMKAVVYEGNGILRLEERPIPHIKTPRDAVVRVTLTTICSSDIHILHGAVPRAVPGTILGHEFVGIVEEAGSEVTRVKPGDRVAVNVETFCGECFYCQRGYVNNCTDEHGGWALGCRIDGGQSEYVRIPFADNGLTPIPASVTDEAALFTGDILSTGYWGAGLAEIGEGGTAAVIGAGPTGLCTMMCARLYHPGKLIAIDTSQERLELAKRRGLADYTLNPRNENVLERVLELTSGRGADSVLEVAGGKDTFQMAWQIARPNAVVCVVALYEEPQVLPLPSMYGKNLIFKTGGVDANSCSEILKLIEEGKLDTGCLITHRTDLAHILEAYEIFEKQADHVLKYAITI